MIRLPSPSFSFLSPALICSALLAVAPSASADPISIDSVLVSAHDPAGTVSAIAPVLKSDLMMVAQLTLATIHGPAWREYKTTRPHLLKTFRTILITRVLAWEAKNMGDKVDKEKRGRLLDRFEASAGGPEQLKELLALSGTSAADLKIWAGEILLAAEQIRYQKERVESPTETEVRALFESGDHPFGNETFEDLAQRLKTYLLDQRHRQNIRPWISDLISKHNLRTTN